MGLEQDVDYVKALITDVKQEQIQARLSLTDAEKDLMIAIKERQPDQAIDALKSIADTSKQLLLSVENRLAQAQHDLTEIIKLKIIRESRLLSQIPSANSNESLDISVSSISSCRSFSQSGVCSTGRHVNRKKKAMSKMRDALIIRDGCCVASGESDLKELVAAHIVPLSQLHLISRDLEYSPKNGILLRKDLEQSYDLFQWMFDDVGRVIVLYERWIHKNDITKIDLCGNSESRPSSDLIAIHNSLDRDRSQGCCPNCWKFVGMYNIDAHQKSSCEAIDVNSDAQDDTSTSDFRSDVDDTGRQENSYSFADCDNTEEQLNLISKLNVI
ncbi:hypothetical protein MP228_005493 [Amoeboaphelidium protococcarum]|nr:hypothetical protein MP228_005493 [Amoeboaphelidium protococcarum]